MKIRNIYLLFIVAINQFSVQASKNNKLLELEGAFTLSSYNSAYRVILLEKIGFNINEVINVGMRGEQEFRNFSFNNEFCIGGEYRFRFKNICVPIGAMGGGKMLYIVQYKDVISVFGIKGGIYYSINDMVSVRLHYHRKLYFDVEKVWGNNILFGLCYKFLSHSHNDSGEIRSCDVL